MNILGTAMALPLFLAAPSAHGESAATKTTETQARPRIEVAFVLDATGSMSPYINEARRRIKEIAQDLQSGDPAPIVKFALVTYRDRGEEYVTHVDPFSAKIEDIRRHLDEAKAKGGGDHPEAVLEGIEAALTKLRWSTKNTNVIKLAYLVGDAPAQHYSGGPTEKEMTALARKKGVVLHTIECGGSLGKEGTETWSHLARLTEGRALKLTSSRRSRRTATAGDRGTSDRATGDFASVVGGTSKVYSASVGVDYKSAPSITTTAMTTPGTEIEFRSGLIGGHVRWVRDAISWNDVWAAHVSLLPKEERPVLPVVDFSASHVLVAGGAAHALAIHEVRGSVGARTASVQPLESGGVAFVVVPREGGAVR